MSVVLLGSGPYRVNGVDISQREFLTSPVVGVFACASAYALLTAFCVFTRRYAARRLMLLPLLSLTVGACSPGPTAESEAAVRSLWSEYLASKNGQYAPNASEPSPLWDAAEQAQWPVYDMAAFYLPNGAIPEVLSVTPLSQSADTAFRIVTRFWPAGSTVRDSSVLPEMTMTVFARRQRRRWVLANALTYHTAAWQRETRGRISFRVAPSLQFNAGRAERAAAFVDSLASAFGVAPPPRIDYYVTESVDQALEIQGTAYPQRYGAAGGFSKPVNYIVFSGIPTLGEDYRHELAHVVLMPIIRESSTTLLASEGVPTWFGGTAGRDYTHSVRHLDSLLVAQPHITLDAVVDDLSLPSDIRNAAGAVLAELLHERGGAAAVTEYLRSPERGLRGVLERLLGRPWVEITGAWRERVRRHASASSSR